jgi:FtsZ-interacting cell division protein ZipA
MSWTVIILIAIPALIVVGFLTFQNWKDEKKFEKQLDTDYRKPRDEEGDIEIDEKIK